ncbi:MAG: S8 family serine peptidase [Verrucomicrobiota bacterium]
MRKKFLQFSLVFLAVCCFGTHAGIAIEPLVWHGKEKTFDADVSRLELRQLLQNISNLTGWEVYLEPGTSFQASAKFKNLPRGDALRLLLGKLNFEISPQTNSVPKLFVFKTGAENATQLIEAEKKSVATVGKDKPISNHLIVTLKSGSGININVLAQQLGAKVIGKLEGLDAYLLEFPDEAAAIAAREKLSRVSDVASVDSNYSLERPTPFAMASVDARSPFNLKPEAGGGNGSKIVVGLIDTAVQQLGGDMQGFLLTGLSVAGDANPSTDFPTHGTTMAESVLFGLNSMLEQGQGTSMRILPIDIYGANPSTTTFNVASGITLAVNNGANILSLSLGSEGNSPFLEKLLQQAREKNILIFAAAGNQPVTSPVYPAAYPSVIAVTSAGNSKGTIAPYANRGSFVDVILPGATLISFNGQNFYANGTSVSAALASGMMAGLAERSKRPPVQLEQTFRNTVPFQPSQP